MDFWEEFAEGTAAAAKAIAVGTAVVGLGLLSFIKLTVPIMLALFTSILDANAAGEVEVITTIVCWIIIFFGHIALYAWALGFAIRKGPKAFKAILKVVDDESS